MSVLLLSQSVTNVETKYVIITWSLKYVLRKTLLNSKLIDEIYTW